MAYTQEDRIENMLKAICLQLNLPLDDTLSGKSDLESYVATVTTQKVESG